MTLDDLWILVNNTYENVLRLSDSTRLSLWTTVATDDHDFFGYISDLNAANWGSYANVFNYIVRALVTLRSMIHDGYRHLDYEINNHTSNIELLFSNYMQYVIKYIRDAVDLTWEHTQGAGEVTKADLDKVVANITGRIETEVNVLSGAIIDSANAVRSQIGVEIEQTVGAVPEGSMTILDWISGAYTDLETWVDETYTEVTDTITTQIKAVKVFAQGLIDAVTTYIDKTIIAVKKIISDLAVSATAYIDKMIEEVTFWADSFIRQIRTKLRTRINNVRAFAEKAVDIIQSALDEITILSDWRFAFFNWFVIRPELSMLSVLTRDDDTFAYWRPYWQAFLARVLEEE